MCASVRRYEVSGSEEKGQESLEGKPRWLLGSFTGALGVKQLNPSSR